VREAPKTRKPTDFRSWAILAFLLLGLGAFFWFDLHQYISFQTLAEQRDRLQNWVSAWPVLAPVVLYLIYAVSVLFSLPIAAVLSVAAGFLFGTVEATAIVALGATTGAAGLFILARSAFGERWRPTVDRWLQRLDKGFHENAFQYLLVLRLIPAVPFFVLNIVPAFAGISLRSYVIATFLGILPGTVVYTSIGAGLDEVFARGDVPDLSILTDPAIVLPLVGLALLAALPLAYRWWRANCARSETRDVTPSI